jgi:hypothetical protein
VLDDQDDLAGARGHLKRAHAVFLDTPGRSTAGPKGSPADCKPRAVTDGQGQNA